jgi:hypothetical protein
VAVGGFDQMRLCAAAHLPDQSAGVNGHDRESGTLEII